MNLLGRLAAAGPAAAPTARPAAAPAPAALTPPQLGDASSLPYAPVDDEYSGMEEEEQEGEESRGDDEEAAIEPDYGEDEDGPAALSDRAEMEANREDRRFLKVQAAVRRHRSARREGFEGCTRLAEEPDTDDESSSSGASN